MECLGPRDPIRLRQIMAHGDVVIRSVVLIGALVISDASPQRLWWWSQRQPCRCRACLGKSRACRAATHAAPLAHHRSSLDAE